ncbi:MAG: PDZ domain-containing protein, partial [Gammaproteobacteria bacterium]|nr:PDZ domain-containing protein [Gammaproteobacteria bacterium]
MLSTLDPHSEFLSPEQARLQDETALGRIGGIGIEVEVRDGRIYVAELVEGGPASRAGVQAGDMITAVDGKPVKGNPLWEAMEGLRGVPGTEVQVTFGAYRGERAVGSRGQKPRTLTLVREYIPVPSVRGELLEERFGYFRITHFHVDSSNELQAALQTRTEERPGGLDGIILDLRGNGGGVIGAAIAMADGFLDEGLLVYTRGRQANKHLEYFAQEGQWAPGVPVVVLVNGRTASASEILAGALQDHGRAVLVGETTFGKATVQTVLQLRNGSALKLTTARYYTPDGKSISETGISPDVPASDTRDREGDPDEALEAALDILRGDRS